MPAIWCPKRRVDHIKQAQMKGNTQKIRHNEGQGEEERGSANESLPGSSSKEDNVPENCATGSENDQHMNVNHFEFGAHRQECCSRYHHEKSSGHSAEYGARLVVKDCNVFAEDFNQQRCYFQDKHCHGQGQVSQRYLPHCHTCSSHLNCTHNCVECTVQSRSERDHSHVVSNIHESFKEIRKEMADFHRDSTSGTTHSGMENAVKAYKRKRDKPRRRGRGNWSYGKEYLDAIQDAKRTRYEARFGHETAENPNMMVKCHSEGDDKVMICHNSFCMSCFCRPLCIST